MIVIFTCCHFLTTLMTNPPFLVSKMFSFTHEAEKHPAPLQHLERASVRFVQHDNKKETVGKNSSLGLFPLFKQSNDQQSARIRTDWRKKRPAWNDGQLSNLSTSRSFRSCKLIVQLPAIKPQAWKAAPEIENSYPSSTTWDGSTTLWPMGYAPYQLA